MPRPDAAFGKQQQKPGQKLISDFESLSQDADTDAAVEFLSKNGSTIAGSMDSEEAFDLLKKLPRGVQRPETRGVLQGVLQTVYDRSMKAEPGTDLAAAFEKRGSQTGVAFLEKNLNVIDPEQVADIITQLRAIDFPYTDDPNERRKQDQFRARVDALVEKVDSISPPEAKRDVLGKPDLRVVSPAEEATISAALARTDTLKEAFDSYRGNLSEATKAKVEKWQKELFELRGVLTDESGLEIDTLYEQMTDYVHSVNEASKARQVIGDRQAQSRGADSVRPAAARPAPKAPASTGAAGWFKRTFMGK